MTATITIGCHYTAHTISWMVVLGTLVVFWAQPQHYQYHVSGFLTHRLHVGHVIRSVNLHPSIVPRHYLPSSLNIDEFGRSAISSQQTHRRCDTLVLASSDPDDRESQNDDDADFYRDLERAKIEKLGMNIPPEEARKTAIQSEQDLLAAMKEVSKEFQQAKDELGSDGAVDLFINRIQEEEDERNEQDRKRKEEQNKKKRDGDDLGNAFQ